MGTLNLPASGEVYVDTAPLIYSVEKYPAYWALLQPLWAASQSGQITLVVSELALLETLTGPLKHGNTALAAAYENLLTNTEILLQPITAAILRQAAQIRAQYNLKTPDAIHAATALAAGCAQLITNDAIFRRIPGQEVIVLHEISTT